MLIHPRKDRKMFAKNTICMNLDIKKEGFLWLSDKRYKDWQAFFNGRPVKVYDSPTHFRSVYLPQGKGELLLKYRSVAEKKFFGILVGLVMVLVSYFTLMYINLVNIGNLGLMGLKERTELFGGQMDITSQVGHGTTVLIMLPHNPQSSRLKGYESNRN